MKIYKRYYEEDVHAEKTKNLYANRWIYKIYRVVEKYPRILTYAFRLKEMIFGCPRLKERVLALDKDSLSGAFKKQVKEIKIAAVLDEFSYYSLKEEALFFMVEPDGWVDLFEKQKPDLFFCESAWSGMGKGKDAWRGKIYKNPYLRRENRQVLLSILAYCRDHNIPTVFWNKEDPSHYGDCAHDFAATAALFDHIFTTAKECEALYQNDYGHSSVHTLMFGVQPKLFNPIEKYERTDEVVFAGSWYSYHTERCRQMRQIFDELLRRKKRLKIYDRYYGDSDPNHRYPDQYLSYISPSLPYQEIDKAYKGSHFALNITTVTDSNTMFARRVFELAASHTAVLSNYSQGIEKIFGNHVIYLDRAFDWDGIEEKREWNLYEVLRRHTYKERLKQVLDDIHFPYEVKKTFVAVFYFVREEQDIENADMHFQSITYKNRRKYIFMDPALSARAKEQMLFRRQEQRLPRVFAGGEQYALAEDEEYFILVGRALPGSFVEKALCHFSYLSQDVLIGSGEPKYCYSTRHTLFNFLGQRAQIRLFDLYRQGKESEEFKTYLI